MVRKHVLRICRLLYLFNADTIFKKNEHHPKQLQHIVHITSINDVTRSLRDSNIHIFFLSCFVRCYYTCNVYIRKGTCTWYVVHY